MQDFSLQLKKELVSIDKIFKNAMIALKVWFENGTSTEFFDPAFDATIGYRYQLCSNTCHRDSPFV
jgi:hypothetical protein